ncbi:TetR/AcrR family transcriptional regulator [Desulfobotulus sp. H1]|uniref:TetR/AcrR family transcriptional regulator n=1 Tax=Desulfobotulus pelophilus TaxID=2823377 RepID=A0ABT3NBP0_9BACT|nr:TetR/AcrR family transcriptional regulator [Desulfobotulus pelophilus]MCW7754882.1 TetR/AcrR family transcriptional regulator [Desulfobotulus pelophilus]
MNDMSVTAPDKATTRQNILDAAVRIFREKGFQKARVSDIVSAAGLAQGTFYLYFRSKEDIARQICKKFMDRFTRIFEEDHEVFDSTSLSELHVRIRKMIHSALKTLKEDANAAEIVLREGIGQGGLFKELYEDLILSFIELLREKISMGASRNILGIRDPHTTAVFIVGLVERSFFFFMIMKKELDIDTIAADMSAFILKGLDPAPLP